MFKNVVLWAAIASAAGSAAARGQSPRLPSFDKRTPVVLAVENVGPSVVSIKTQSKVDARSHPFGGLFQRWDEDVARGYADRSVGSGVVIHSDGYVVTNEHVIAGADRISVQFKGEGEGEGRKFDAELLNSDVANDLAVLRILGKSSFPTAVFGDASSLMVGETTIALGCPFGIGDSVTIGVLSAKNRPVVFRGKEVFRDFLQTSALIHPGNSGGPLLDLNGYVVGINVAIDQRGAGIGYAIPVDRVLEVVTRLTDPAVVRRASLGLDVESARDGLRIAQVDEDGPAAKAGLKVGDVVSEVGGSRVSARLEFNLALLSLPEDSQAEFGVRRGDRKSAVAVAFEKVPLSALSRRSFGNLGFAVADVTPQIAREYGLESAAGVVITTVEKDGLAERIDLRPGDILYQAGGYRVKDADNLAGVLRAVSRAARGVEVLVLRAGKPFGGTMPLR